MNYKQEYNMQKSIIESEVVSLNTAVEVTIKRYLESMGQDKIVNLYDMVLEQMEPALLKAVIEHCRYNQSRAATMLGLSRGTCRAKLIKYFNDQYCGRHEVE